MPIQRIILISIVILLHTTPLFAEQEFIGGIGKGMDNTLIQSKSISSAGQYEVSWAYNLDKSFSNDYGYWQWWLQAGYVHLKGQHNGEKNTLSIVELKPILRLYPSGENGKLFFEGGLGASKFSRKQFEQITVQIKGNFAVHFAAGYRINDLLRVSLRYSHFSNGYTHTPNPGLDTMSLNLHLVWN
ncbi:MAG TPA: acyloxyacyl hydrolase [Aeromonadales bacterium]|nr:acyloxyacyl hydrolase [Aeromonadales bacterium]